VRGASGCLGDAQRARAGENVDAGMARGIAPRYRRVQSWCCLALYPTSGKDHGWPIRSLDGWARTSKYDGQRLTPDSTGLWAALYADLVRVFFAGGGSLVLFCWHRELRSTSIRWMARHNGFGSFARRPVATDDRGNALTASSCRIQSPGGRGQTRRVRTAVAMKRAGSRDLRADASGQLVAANKEIAALKARTGAQGTAECAAATAHSRSVRPCQRMARSGLVRLVAIDGFGLPELSSKLRRQVGSLAWGRKPTELV